MNLVYIARERNAPQSSPKIHLIVNPHNLLLYRDQKFFLEFQVSGKLMRYFHMGIIRDIQAPLGGKIEPELICTSPNLLELFNENVSGSQLNF